MKVSGSDFFFFSMFGVLLFVCLFNIAWSEHPKEMISPTLLWLSASKMSLEAGSESGDATETKVKEQMLMLCKIADEKWFNNGYKHSYKGRKTHPDSHLTILIPHLKNELQFIASKLQRMLSVDPGRGTTGGVFPMCLDNKVIREGLKDLSGEVILYLMLVEEALACCSLGWIYFGGLRIFLPLYKWLLKIRSRLQSFIGIFS